jgi:ATP-dependent DNA helicase RecQ
MQRVFGIDEFRPGQDEVIRSVIDGRNTLAVMPTGAGKSLCYQLASLYIPGATVVASPLISLMKDQVDKLDDLGLPADQVSSALTSREESQAVERIEQERSDFVLTTPERLSTPEFLQTLTELRVGLFVIDEAHCISQWGHDFRPAYLALKDVHRALGKPPLLALTATAPPAVIDDIAKQLDIPDFNIINTGTYRPNLIYEVIRTASETDKRSHLARLLREIDGTGIIYTSTIKNVETVLDYLKALGIEARRYHGRVSSRERKENQDDFMAGKLKAIVATNAFGMGIDKQDIRFVIHYNMPGSLDAYYQESGRAGRDGQPARCILFYQLEDRRTQLFFLGSRYPKVDDVRAVYEALSGLRAHETPAVLADIQQAASGVARTKVRVILSMLKDMGLVKTTRTKFSLTKPDVSSAAIEKAAKDYNERHEGDRKKLEQMMLYAQTARCRWTTLLDYFGEAVDWDLCGSCDNCRHPVELDVAPPTSTDAAAARSAEREPTDDKLRDGDEVKLPKYGRGRIRSIHGDIVEVEFGRGEVRKFKKEYVR